MVEHEQGRYSHKHYSECNCHECTGHKERHVVQKTADSVGALIFYTIVTIGSIGGLVSMFVG